MNLDLWAVMDLDASLDLSSEWERVGYVDTSTPKQNVELGKHVAAAVAHRAVPRGRSVGFYAFIDEEAEFYATLSAAMGDERRELWHEKASPRFRLAFEVRHAPVLFGSGYATAALVGARAPEKHPGSLVPGVPVGLKVRAASDRPVLVKAPSED